jgi:hypothetical protein
MCSGSRCGANRDPPCWPTWGQKPRPSPGRCPVAGVGVNDDASNGTSTAKEWSQARAFRSRAVHVRLHAEAARSRVAEEYLFSLMVSGIMKPVPATYRLALPRNVRRPGSFVLKGSGPRPPRRLCTRCPRKPPLYSDEPVGAFRGVGGLEHRRSRGHRRAWNHDRPGRDRRTRSKHRGRQRQRGSESASIPRPANRHIIPEPRPMHRERPRRHRCCRAGSAANGEHCAESPSPWC